MRVTPAADDKAASREDQPQPQRSTPAPKINDPILTSEIPHPACGLFYSFHSDTESRVLRSARAILRAEWGLGSGPALRPSTLAPPNLPPRANEHARRPRAATDRTRAPRTSARGTLHW